MAVKTFTGLTLFGPIPDRNSRDHSLTTIKHNYYNICTYLVKYTSTTSNASREEQTQTEL